MVENRDGDLWRYLCRSDKHIVMYGMGNGADKVLSVCERYNIEVEDFFASDGFVRGHCFHGKRVLSYSETVEKYGRDNMIVLLSFASSLPDVLENIYRISEECEFYAPDVPVFGNEIFNFEYCKAHERQINEARELLADCESRRIFDLIIDYKLSGDIKYLRDAESSRDEAYREILHSDKIETAADLGAYNGDSARELLSYAENLKKIIALEPDRRNFRKLSEYAEKFSEQGIDIEAHNLGAWSVKDTLVFDSSGNRNSGLLQNASSFTDLGAKKKFSEVEVTSLDSLLDGRGVDYIKYDVEGSEREALLGARETIRKYSPSLLVSLYHRSGDIFELPLLVKQLNPDYKLYLRRMRYIPAWDINLYAVKE